MTKIIGTIFKTANIFFVLLYLFNLFNSLFTSGQILANRCFRIGFSAAFFYCCSLSGCLAGSKIKMVAPFFYCNYFKLATGFCNGRFEF